MAINQIVNCPMDPKQRQILDLLEELAEEMGYERLEWSLGDTRHREETERLDVWDCFPAGLYGEQNGSAIRVKISITKLLKRAHEEAVQGHHNELNGPQSEFALKRATGQNVSDEKKHTVIHLVMK